MRLLNPPPPFSSPSSQPGPSADPAALVGARTDADLYAALKPPPGHDPDAPVREREKRGEGGPCDGPVRAFSFFGPSPI